MNGCAAVITWGIDPYKTAHDNVANGFDFLGLKNTMTENKRCSEIFDYLGWCSWDGFRTNVNSEGVYGKLDEFKKKGVSFTAVCPGPVDTSFFTSLENVKEYKKRFLITPERVARKAKIKRLKNKIRRTRAPRIANKYVIYK